MKAVVINSSPHKEAGLTSSIMRPFVEGMLEAGADVEVVYTAKLKLEPCTGCFSCWGVTPGACILEDDLNAVLEALKSAERWVFASPVYSDGLSAGLKIVLERLIVTLKPVIAVRDGHTRHLWLDGLTPSTVALISSCGMHELDQFDPALAQIEAFCGNFGRPFAGALLRPHSQALRAMKQAGQMDDIVLAAMRAGRSFITEGRIVPQDAETVSRELMEQAAYVGFFNELIRQGAAKTSWNMKKVPAA
ncbi:MAG: flavodoxin family protein [Hyphomicrobiales bacterium]